MLAAVQRGARGQSRRFTVGGNALRFVTFTPRAHGPQHRGLIRDGKDVIDLKNAGGEPPFDAADMISLIAAGDAALAWLRDVAAKSRNSLPLDKVILLAPIPRPRKNVFCVGWNYLEHFEEGPKARPHVQE